MIRKLLFMLLLLGSVAASAQFAGIGIIGSATPTGWDSDTDMATTDGVVYTLNNFTLTAGQIKFRKDNLWTENWGGATFPSGPALPNGQNLNVLAGIYNVTFNLSTLQYNFVNVSGFTSISLLGEFSSWTDVPMGTTDGVHYSLKYQTLSSGDVKFRSTGSWTSNWGGNTFPSGTGVADGMNIIVPGGTYNVDFNLQTLAYNFSYVSIGIIGTAADGWSNDVMMSTTNGVDYYLEYPLVPGELKFRANNNWDHNWGGTFPDGVATDGGSNFIVNAAGTYAISFNNQTKDFSFNVLLGTRDHVKSSLTVHTNPSSGGWTFSSRDKALETIVISDVTGKVVANAKPGVTEGYINAEHLEAGIYFAKVSSGSETATIKVIKK